MSFYGARPLIPLFIGLLVSSLVGFKARVGSLICTWQRCPWCTFSYSVGLSFHQLSVVRTFHWKVPRRSVVNHFTPFGMKQIWTKRLNYVLITALLTLGWDIRLKLPEASVFIVQQNQRKFQLSEEMEGIMELCLKWNLVEIQKPWNLVQ